MSPRTPQKSAIEITAEELADTLPKVAARMREVAHIETNWLHPMEGDTLLGREGHRRAGLVPANLLKHDDAARTDIESFANPTTPVSVDDLRPYLTYRYRLVEHRNVMSCIYVVETGTPRADGATGPVRHLSLQFTVPGRVGQGDIVRHQADLAQLNEWVVLAFMPAAKLGVPVGMKLRAGEPWEVVDPEAPMERRVLHYKTPVSFDFLMDHDLGDRRAPTRKVQLYGPDGGLL